MEIKKLRKILITITLIFLLYVPMIYAQPGTLWTKTYGGSNWDIGNSIQQTADGGFIITGSTNSFGAGNNDIWLVKTDSIGNEMWNQTFGGNKDDIGNSVQQTIDRGYVITGWTQSFGYGSYEVWLIKTDANGNEVWNKTFGGSDIDMGYSVEQTADSGYIFIGWTNSHTAGYNDDIWLIKTDSNGNKLWERIFGGGKSDSGKHVQQTNDGGYIIAGSTASYGSGDNDVWLIKTDSGGNKVWSRTFGGRKNDGSHCLQQTADGGYIITGWTHSYGLGDGDIWLIKTDSNGNKVWSQTFGGSKHDDGISVQQTMDGGYIITGYSRSLGAGDWDTFLIKTDSNGKEEWIKTFGGIYSDFGSSVQQTTDGGYVITGATNSHSSGNHDDVWLIKIAPDITGVDRDSKKSPVCFILEQNYPNPFNVTTNILYSISRSDFVTLIVYDVLGRQMHTLVDEFQDSGTYSVNFDASKFSSGIYFYKLQTDAFTEVRKMMLLR